MDVQDKQSSGLKVLRSYDETPCKFSLSPEVFFEDLQTLKERFNAIRESYSIAMTVSRCNIWEYDVASRTLYVPEGQSEMVELQRFGTTFADIPESLIAEEIVHPDDADDLRKMYQDIHAGMDRAGCVVRMRNLDSVYRWNRFYCQVKKGEKGNSVSALGIAQDIQQEWEMERRYDKEYRLRRSMTADAMIVYELNLTRDMIWSISASGDARPGGAAENSVTGLVQYAADHLIYQPHRMEFMKQLSREAMLKKFDRGVREVSMEYRRLNAEGKMGWVSATIHLYSDADKDGEVFGLFVIRDINESKMREEELQRKAELDLLTGLYNRATAMANAEELLIRMTEKSSIGALMILDIDNFKKVNDTYGHVYGDAVLSEISRKLKNIFRPNDIIGRLGGDEFIVFLPDLPSEEAAIHRADEVCTALHTTYSSGAEPCEVSVSVGIVFAPHQGRELSDLYQKADAALYQAKENGRDGYVIYDEKTATTNHPDTCTLHLKSEGETIHKSFSENMLEFIFKILHSYESPEQAVPPVLELLARHYDAQRAYVYERHPVTGLFSLSYEWCNAEYKPAKEYFPQVLPGMFSKEADPLRNQEILCVNNTELEEGPLKQVGMLLGTKSLIQCSIKWGKHRYGFVGVDDCSNSRIFTEEERSTIYAVANIIGEYLITHRMEHSLEQQTSVLRDLLDAHPTISFVIDFQTQKLIFLNRRARERFPNVQTGQTCNVSFCCGTACCERCPLKQMDVSQEETNHISVKVPFLEGECYEITTRWVHWNDGGQYIMLNFVPKADIM